MTLTAKNINDSFWILQKNGQKIGNLSVTPDRVVITQEKQQETFDSLDAAIQKYPMEFVVYKTPQSEATMEVLGYPTRSVAYNGEFDVHHQLPLYTELSDSHSKRCAGYYAVNLGHRGWFNVWCPKLLTLKRNIYAGPFATWQEAQDVLEQHNVDHSSHTSV